MLCPKYLGFIIICYGFMLLILSEVVSVHGQFGNVVEMDEDFVDPSDMGSYSHSQRRNVEPRHQHNGRYSRRGDIEETVVKQAIYVDRSDSNRQITPDTILTLNNDSVKKQQQNTVSLETIHEGQTQEIPYVQVTETITKYRKSENNCPTLDTTLPMIYLKRIVGSLLSQMDVNSHMFGPGETITIDLRGEISFESVKTLRKFLEVRDGDGEKGLEEVDQIMSHLLHPVHNHQPIGAFEFMKEKLLLHIPNITTIKFWLILFTLTVVGFITTILCYQMFGERHNIMRFLFYGFLLMVVFSCIWNYAQLHESETAENTARMEQHDIIPRECNYYNLTFLERMQYYFKVTKLGYEDPCVQYYKVHTNDPFYRTSPIVAISTTFAQFVFHPMRYIGEKIGGFLEGIINGIPFWLQPFFLILIFLFAFLPIFGYRIRTPFISIEPAPRAQLTGPSLQAALSNSQNQSGPIVRLHRMDASTSTDDLEDYILGLMDPPSNNFGLPQPMGCRLSLNACTSRWQSYYDTLLKYMDIIFHLVITFFAKILRDSPSPTVELESDEEPIWEHRQNFVIDQRQITSRPLEPEGIEVIYPSIRQDQVESVEAVAILEDDEPKGCSSTCNNSPSSRDDCQSDIEKTELNMNMSQLSQDLAESIKLELDIEFDEASCEFDDDLLDGDLVEPEIFPSPFRIISKEKIQKSSNLQSPFQTLDQ